MTLVSPEFAYLQKLVFERSAIVLADDKGYLVESRLQPIVRSLGLQSTLDVLDRVRRTKDRPLEDKIVEAMTTNETLWFRDIHPFNALRRQVLPEIAGRKATSQQLAVWSAASSSGQEIYSIAMILQEDFPALQGWRVDLLGTDLSSEMVERAREGRYSTLEVNRGLPVSLLVRHFTQEGNSYRINEGLRRGARFMEMNLAAPWPSLPRFDVIMLRNVLIYFDVPTKRRIIEAAAGALAPQGYLFLGAAETMMGVCDRFESQTVEGAVLYRLKGQS